MTLDWVIDRAVENALQRLAGVHLPSPAYAIALMNPDPDSLYPYLIMIGLEPDRQRILASVPRDRAWHQIWNAWDFTAGPDREPDLWRDHQLTQVQDTVREQLQAQGHDESRRHVLKLIARRLAATKPISPVTPDFVVYAFDDRFDEGLIEDIRFSGSPQALARLETQGLLPTFPRPPY